MERKSINVRMDTATIEVQWDNNGKEHRRAYSGFERDAFLADVPDGLAAAEECWPNWELANYIPTPAIPEGGL